MSELDKCTERKTEYKRKYDESKLEEEAMERQLSEEQERTKASKLRLEEIRNRSLSLCGLIRTEEDTAFMLLVKKNVDDDDCFRSMYRAYEEKTFYHLHTLDRDAIAGDIFNIYLHLDDVEYRSVVEFAIAHNMTAEFNYKDVKCPSNIVAFRKEFTGRSSEQQEFANAYGSFCKTIPSLMSASGYRYGQETVSTYSMCTARSFYYGEELHILKRLLRMENPDILSRTQNSKIRAYISKISFLGCFC